MAKIVGQIEGDEGPYAEDRQERTGCVGLPARLKTPMAKIIKTNGDLRSLKIGDIVNLDYERGCPSRFAGQSGEDNLVFTYRNNASEITDVHIDPMLIPSRDSKETLRRWSEEERTYEGLSAADAKLYHIRDNELREVGL